MKKSTSFAAIAAISTACAFGANGDLAADVRPNGTNDMTRAILDAVAKAKTRKSVVLAQGDYHFYAESARKMDIYISNHDQDLPRRVQLPLCGVGGRHGLTIRGAGDGAHFIFHGESTGILVMDSERVVLSNISLDWAQSPIGEARIASIENGGAPKLEWVVRAFDGEGSARMLWDAQTHAIKPNTGDGFSMSQAVPGDFISYRSWTRPSPAICLYRARMTLLDNVVVHSAHGMGLLAQRSENIAWRGGGVYPRSGCICSTKADATHFSNCRGRISVTGALFSGMMDDAINVHSTCLRIVGKPSANKIRCRYMHPQAIGFEVFERGEKLRFIKARTLENGPVCTVESVERENPTTIVLSLDASGAAALADYDEGDAVENADWQPSVVFSGNTVKNNRARAALFTTPGKVVVTGNAFDRVSGSAILFAGDAANWYESGACEDVLISGNTFKDCLTSKYQFCTAVIAAAPTVQDVAAQKTAYHRNIRVTDNTFSCPGAKLYDGVSVEGLVWEGNRE